MEFEQDYIMRMIKGKTAALARIIFRKTSPQYELPEENKYTAADDLFARLVRMADAGAVNKAENIQEKRSARGSGSCLRSTEWILWMRYLRSNVLHVMNIEEKRLEK